MIHKDTMGPIEDEVVCVLADEEVTVMQVGEVHVVAGLRYLVMSMIKDGMIYRREIEAGAGGIIRFDSIKREASRFWGNVMENTLCQG